ncbi:MAG TPA: TlpA family protein disulfide reductase [Longimicrobiales bacterium]|nr:TlpA family protein disulfide reductase [Longimicrobiales bacterium]
MRRTRSRLPRSRTLAGVPLVFLLALCAGVAPDRAAAQDDGIALGSVVQPFTIEDLDGEAVDLAEVIGRKPVLVEFWATWCPVCRVLDPKLAAAHSRFGDEVEFLVVAVGVGQRKEQIAAHIARHPVAGRLLWDGRGAAARAFEAPGTGYVVLLDAAGKVVWTGTGTGQDIDGALQRLVSR